MDLLQHFAQPSLNGGFLANLSSMAGERWYHGTKHPFQPGDMVGRPHYKNWATSDLEDAHGHGYFKDGSGPARIFEVEPTGPNLYDGKTGGWYESDKPMRVVREVSYRRDGAHIVEASSLDEMPGHFEAASRPPRGHEPCTCCSGKGTHGDTSSCTRCDGAGHLPKDDRSPHCPGQPQPRRRHWRQADRRDDRLAAMNPHDRAQALAQEHTRFEHPRLGLSLGEYPQGRTRVNPTLIRWLQEGGHPRADEAYIARHSHPERGTSNSGRGPDGEPVVALHPERWDYGTLAHEAAHLLRDHETGRQPNDPPASPEGVHDDAWAGHYARMLNDLERGAGDTYLEARRQRLPEDAAPDHAVTASAESGGLDEITASGPDDYGMSHRPTAHGAPLHDLAGEQPGADFDTTAYQPADYYTHPQYHSFGPDEEHSEREALSVMRKVRGKPDARVTIYRASPVTAPHRMHTGDWVSLSRSYAESHAELRSSEADGGGAWHVHSAEVPAHHVRDAGSGGYLEHGYWGPDVVSHSLSAAHQAAIEREAAASECADHPGELADGTDAHGHPVHTDPLDGPHHLDGSIGEDDGSSVSDHPVHAVTAGISRDDLDRHLENWFHPDPLEAERQVHPRSGFHVQVGQERRLARPEEGQDEGPAEFDVIDHGQLHDNRLAYPRHIGREPVQHVYRGVSAEEWHQARQRGYLQSDSRGTIADWEGTNAADEPDTAVTYLPRGGQGHVLKIRVHPEDGWFTHRADNYLRTRQQIPLDRVEGVSPLIAKDEKTHLSLPEGDQPPALEHRTAANEGPVYYHGSASALQPGDLIDPDEEIGRKRGQPGHAYSTTSLDAAHNYAYHKSNAVSASTGEDRPPHTYQVEPLGHIERDDTVDDRFGAHRSRQPMRVIREIPHPGKLIPADRIGAHSEPGMAHFGATDWNEFYDKISPGAAIASFAAPESRREIGDVLGDLPDLFTAFGEALRQAAANLEDHGVGPGTRGALEELGGNTAALADDARECHLAYLMGDR